jgi:RNA polymerase sigma-70 factor, ECF subfamily
MNLRKTRTLGASDEELMVAIQAGNSRALESLYNRYSKRLLTYFYRMLGVEDKAQDFLQDIFLKLIERPYAFDASRIFSKWIFSIAANMCKNEYRSLEVRKAHQNNGVVNTVHLGDPHSNIADTLDREEFRTRLEREIMKLDADHRNTFLLRFQEDFSIGEIAHILNCPEGTVKSRLFYITKKLANSLRNFDTSVSEVNYHEDQK